MTSNNLKKIKFPAIIALLIILLSLPLAIFFGVRREKKYIGKAAYLASPPLRVNVTNIHPKGFTVSWATNQDTVGKILFYGEVAEAQTVKETFEDARKTGAQEIVGKTHYVNVKDPKITGVSLEPDKTYYFRLQSGTEGNFYCGRSGADITRRFESINCASSPGTPFAFQVKTAKVTGDDSQPPTSLNPYGAYSEETGAFLACPDGSASPPQVNCYRPNPLYGFVRQINGTGISGAIVYLTIKDSSGNIKSNKISALTETDPASLGRWVQDIANFYKTDFTSYLSYKPFNLSPKDTVSIEADNGIVTTTKENITIPEVIADACTADHTTALNCNTPPGDNDIFPIIIQIVEPSGTPVPERQGDITGDGYVDIKDLNKIILTWYEPESGAPVTGKQGDITGDGYVDIKDLNKIILYWYEQT